MDSECGQQGTVLRRVESNDHIDCSGVLGSSAAVPPSGVNQLSPVSSDEFTLAR